MNWLKTLNDLFNTSSGIIVVIVIILTAIITITLEHAIPAFGKFLIHLPQSTKKRWSMFIKCFREWNYWRNYHPDYGIIHVGKVLIEKLGNGDTERYKINLPITIECKNNDELNHVLFDCTKLQANLTIRSKTSRKITYTLRYELGTPQWTIRYSHPLEKANYTLCGYSQYIKTGLGYYAECRIVNLGIVTLNTYQKVLTNKHWFNVKVDWSKIEIPTSHTG